MRGGQLPEHPTKAAVSVDALIRSKLMKLPFSRRNAELENMNRILTDAARKKAERIKEVEDQVAQLERQVAHLKQALESARKRESELEVAATQRAHLLNEKDKEIAALREVLTQRAPLAGLREVLAQRAHLLNDKDEELAGLREVLTQRAHLLNDCEVLTQRAHLLNEKDEELAGLREALTKSSLRIQELENPLFKIAQK